MHFMEGFKDTCNTRLIEGQVIIASLKKLNKDLEYLMKQSLETDRKIIISKTLEGGAIHKSKIDKRLFQFLLLQRHTNMVLLWVA